MEKNQVLWNRPPEDFNLGPEQVHLWKLQLPLSAEVHEHLGSFLQTAERGRSDRFHFERDQYRFSQFRGFLRFLLGSYLKRPPRKIPLEENPQGKPLLSEIPGEPYIYFNLAHSQGTALYAFTLEGAIGVDLEKIKDTYDGEKLAERYFSRKESQWLASLPDPEKPLGFFRLWTLKEAYLKALGFGFKGGLDTFSVQVNKGGNAQLIGKHPEDAMGDWRLKYFALEEEFIGALVAPDSVAEILYLNGNQLEVKG